jgi:hypothetical protein
MFDPRDDARDRDGREDGRARVYDDRDRDHDPREGLMHDLDLPRGEELELVAVRDRVYELDGDDSRTLAAVGAFRVVPEHDLDYRDHQEIGTMRVMWCRRRFSTPIGRCTRSIASEPSIRGFARISGTAVTGSSRVARSKTASCLPSPS